MEFHIKAVDLLICNQKLLSFEKNENNHKSNNLVGLGHFFYSGGEGTFLHEENQWAQESAQSIFLQ